MNILKIGLLTFPITHKHLEIHFFRVFPLPLPLSSVPDIIKVCITCEVTTWRLGSFHLAGRGACIGRQCNRLIETCLDLDMLLGSGGIISAVWIGPNVEASGVSNCGMKTCSISSVSGFSAAAAAASSLSVVRLGANRHLSMRAVSRGWILLPLNPALAFSGVAALFQAFDRIPRERVFCSFCPPFSLVKTRPSMFQLCLRLQKKPLSTGCRMWVVCGGKQIICTLFVFISSKNPKLKTWELCPSNSSTCGQGSSFGREAIKRNCFPQSNTCTQLISPECCWEPRSTTQHFALKITISGLYSPAVLRLASRVVVSLRSFE